MLKAAVLILAVALLSSNADAGSYDDKCKDVAKCQAKASVHINLKGPGKCTGTSKAYCKAKSKSFDCFDKDTLYIDSDKCRKKSVTLDAECWAKAAAKAIAKASVEVECIGGDYKKTFACGKAYANAKAVACGFAKAIVDLKISIGGHDNAICEAKVAGAIDAIASAIAKANAEACAKSNDSGIDNEFALAKAIEKVMVDVFGSCFVYCKDTPKKEVAKAVADGGAHAEVVKSFEKEKEVNGGIAIADAGGH